MRKPSRRQFVQSGLGLAGLGIAWAITGRDYITLKEYQAAETTLFSLEHEIDQEHSGFRENSDSLVIYLPDIHKPYYQKRQRPRIESIDQNIVLDAIGLEGIAGEVDPEKVKKLVERSEAYWEANVIPTIVLDEDLDYNILKEDSPEIRLQKLKVAYDEAIDWAKDGYWLNPTVKKDREENNKRHQAALEFEVSTGQLFTIIPHRELRRFRNFNPVSQFMLMKGFQNSDPRLTAPGKVYSNLETRAKMVGMENSRNDGRASDIFDAYTLQLDISKIEQQLEETNRLFAITKKDHENLGTQEEQARTNKRNQAYEAFANELASYKREMIEYRNNLLVNISPEMRNAILACRYNQEGIDGTEEFQPKEYENLVLRQRSQDWITNLSNHRTSMLIGGAAHTDTIAQAAQDNNISLISLTKLS